MSLDPALAGQESKIPLIEGCQSEGLTGWTPQFVIERTLIPKFRFGNYHFSSKLYFDHL